MANAVEQALLLPTDMADLRSMRKHEVFLSLKRDLVMVSPSTSFLTFKITTLFSPSFFFIFFFIFFFLLLYLFTWQAIQATYRAKEMVNFSHKQMKEEEGRRIAVVDAFNVVENKIQELTTKLNEANRDKKHAEASLLGVER